MIEGQNDGSNKFNNLCNYSNGGENFDNLKNKSMSIGNMSNGGGSSFANEDMNS